MPGMAFTLLRLDVSLSRGSQAATVNYPRDKERRVAQNTSRPKTDRMPANSSAQSSQTIPVTVNASTVTFVQACSGSSRHGFTVTTGCHGPGGLVTLARLMCVPTSEYSTTTV